MTDKKNRIDFTRLPDRALGHEWTDKLLAYLFPANGVIKKTAVIKAELRMKLHILLIPLSPRINNNADFIVESFFSQLDEVYDKLLEDAELFVQADPAAECIEEVIAAYPGFYAISIYRIAHILYELKVPVLPRIISEYAHTKTGIDIHPGATISTPFFIDHGTGVVIGQTTVIGKNVKIYQGVTLGALAVRKEESKTKRHPTIEDDVIIYAGSCILGGNTTIGRNSVIGGNVWLTESILPYSIVYNTNEVKVRDKSEIKDVINFII